MQSGDLPDSLCQPGHCIWRSLVLTLDGGREKVNAYGSEHLNAHFYTGDETEEDVCCLSHLNFSCCGFVAASAALMLLNTKKIDLKKKNRFTLKTATSMCASKQNVSFPPHSDNKLPYSSRGTHNVSSRKLFGAMGSLNKIIFMF